MGLSRRYFALLVLVVPAVIWLAGGCKSEGKAAANDDIGVLTSATDPQDRLAASKRLAAQGESVIPAILEAFNKADGKAEAQMALADAVYRMKASAAQSAALEKMAEQTKDKNVSERVLNLARQRKMAH